MLKVPQIDFIPVSNAFLDRYLSSARGDFIKVYLYCLKSGYSNNNISIDNISTSLNLLQTDIMKALEYWEEEGVMRLHPQGAIEILSIKDEVKVDDTPELDKNIKDMFEDIQKLTGRPLSSKEYSIYLDWISSFKFTPEVITLLVEYCTSRGKTDIRYIEKVALGWFDSGIKNTEDAQNYITKHEDKWKRYREILTYAGIKESDISKPQEELLEKWLYTYSLTVDIIKEACRICVMRINECNFSYIDAILNDWYKCGVKKLEDIQKADKKGKTKKKSYPKIPGAASNQRQYDPQELEKRLLGRSEG